MDASNRKSYRRAGSVAKVIVTISYIQYMMGLSLINSNMEYGFDSLRQTRTKCSFCLSISLPYFSLPPRPLPSAGVCEDTWCSGTFRVLYNTYSDQKY
jgi:hypothetical protein